MYTDHAGPVQHWSLWEKNVFFAAIFEILVLATNNKREKVLFGPVSPHHAPNFLLRSTVHKEEPENRFSPILANAIWDQHFRFSRPQRDGRIGGNFETRMIRINHLPN